MSEVSWEGDGIDLVLDSVGSDGEGDVESHLDLERAELAPCARVDSNVVDLQLLDLGGEVSGVDTEFTGELKVVEAKVDSELLASVSLLDPEFGSEVGEDTYVWCFCGDGEVLDVGEAVADVDWLVGSVVVAHSLEGLVEEAGGELELGGGWDLSGVEPSVDWVDLEEGGEKAVDGLLADVGLELRWDSGVLVEHLWEVGDGLFAVLVVEDTSDTELEGGVGDLSGISGEQVEEPLLGVWDSDKSVSLGDQLVEVVDEGDSEFLLNFTLDGVDNLALEESLEHVDEAIPEAAVDGEG